MKKLIGILSILAFLSSPGVCSSCIQPPDLNDSFWALTDLNGEPLIEDTFISIHFDNGKCGGWAGCNAYGGDYISKKPGSINVTSMEQTLVGGPGNYILQEKSFTSALQNIVSYKVKENSLSLFDDKKQKTLVFQKLERFDSKPEELVGRNLYLVSMNDTPVPDGLQITLDFDSSNTASGRSGVFTYTLPYKASGDTLTCGISSHRDGEDSPESERYAGEYLSAIAGSDHRYNLTKKQLEIYTIKGDTLVFYPGTPVAESEMTHLIFPLQWILDNDEETHADSIRITFPASWLEDNPPVSEDESPVELNVPVLLLTHHNESTDPGMITVHFPNSYFSGLPEYEREYVETPPQFTITPIAFHFFAKPGENPPDEMIYVYSRYGPVDWELSCDASWLTISPTEGTARSLVEQKKTKITLSIDTSGLDEGTYNTILILEGKQLIHTREIPITIYVTKAEPGQSPDYDIILLPDSELSNNGLVEGITLTGAEFIYDILTEPESLDFKPKYYFFPEDYCIRITGTIKNETGEDKSVYLRATGYDTDEDEVSYSFQIDTFHFDVGVTIIDIPAYASSEFTLVMGWSEDIDHIKLFASKHTESDIPAP